jgi:hypothetical protein
MGNKQTIQPVVFAPVCVRTFENVDVDCTKQDLISAQKDYIVIEKQKALIAAKIRNDKIMNLIDEATVTASKQLLNAAKRGENHVHIIETPEWPNNDNDNFPKCSDLKAYNAVANKSHMFPAVLKTIDINDHYFLGCFLIDGEAEFNASRVDYIRCSSRFILPE